MRKRMLGIAAASVLASTAFVMPAIATEPQVEICHWSGHYLEDLAIGDIYVSGPPDNPYNELLQDYLRQECPLLGGTVLIVGANSAANGHHAIDFIGV